MYNIYIDVGWYNLFVSVVMIVILNFVEEEGIFRLYDELKWMWNKLIIVVVMDFFKWIM